MRMIGGVGVVVVVIVARWDLFMSASFDLQDCVGETADFSFANMGEGIFFAGIVNIPAMPIAGVSTRTVFVESVLSN